MTDRQEVVVVDGLPETAEVLRAVLEPRGFHISWRSSLSEPLEDDQADSRVLVLHEQPEGDHRPRVIVGRLSSYRNAESRRQALSQPFHYADLIAAIDAASGRPAA